VDQLTIEIDGKPVSCTRGRRLFDILIDATCVIGTACGGKGVCTLCRVVIEAGAPPACPKQLKVLTAEEIARGVRLACRIVVDQPMRVISRP
jgi:adenylate cyclase